MAEIEYFYSAHSLYAYFGSTRLSAIAAAAGRQIRHRPFDLTVLMERIGSPGFTERGKAKRAYFFGREAERWSEDRQAPMVADLPAGHRKDQALPNCFLIAALQQGVPVDALAHRLLEGHWRDDLDLTEPANLERLAGDVGVDPAPLLAAAGSEAVRAAYRANTDEGVERGVFGSPTYIVDGDVFYGQDRLEQVERALARPYRMGWYAGGSH
ncbi:MAG: 2-hydroxychromene-2-carboxylate isomerase [Sneathiellaceae bacterium]